MAQKSSNPISRPRGRPRNFDEADVLETARDVFWTNGYAATSLDELAAATGLNRPSLHAAFGDKHSLYLRTLADNRELSVDGIRQHLSNDVPLRDALYNFLLDAADSTLAGGNGARGCFVVCTAVTEALLDADTRAIAAGYVQDVDQVFRERFERSAAELNAGVDPASAATVASAMLQTLAVRARTGSSRKQLADVARAAVAAICCPPKPDLDNGETL
ncbi:TetR/AcrR family transcriptional regulator [Rhizobium sp. NZLR3b]|uniref:TetR/AcrR family transcriptional regulator n=1 Tax=Rhizobium sp. NZLR3b TaxID=2731101 RepID=UPI001C838EDE|nr:TetR/AcrR family transcriptional regulator [Rhizobium sp. NZLR3b]MBX5193703.1 TetR/AcrR family transcriptional regulator [Rhizobium sp. NZLR3b]